MQFLFSTFVKFAVLEIGEKKKAFEIAALSARKEENKARSRNPPNMARPTLRTRKSPLLVSRGHKGQYRRTFASTGDPLRTSYYSSGDPRRAVVQK